MVAEGGWEHKRSSVVAQPASVSLKRRHTVAHRLESRRDGHREHQADRTPQPSPEHHGNGDGKGVQLTLPPTSFGVSRLMATTWTTTTAIRMTTRGAARSNWTSPMSMGGIRLSATPR